MRILSIYLQNSEKKTKPVLGTYFIGNHKTNSISNNQPKKTSPKKIPESDQKWVFRGLFRRETYFFEFQKTHKIDR